MNRIFIAVSTLIAALTVLCGCSEERIVYSGTDSVMFADSLHILPIQDDTEVFEIKIATMKSSDIDRTYAVEILDSRSNAIEGVHYELLSNSATIKAGEVATSILVKGKASNIKINQGIGFYLRIANRNLNTDIYGDAALTTKVVLQRACPFDLEVFSGYCVLTSTFFADYMQNTYLRLLQSQIDPNKENTIIIKNFYYDGYDISLRLDNDNILYPDLYVDGEQVLGYTGEAFGTIYGNGDLMMNLLPSATSYFSSCEGFMAIYNLVYVDGVGTVGAYTNVVRWITDEEAEVLKKQGY